MIDGIDSDQAMAEIVEATALELADLPLPQVDKVLIATLPEISNRLVAQAPGIDEFGSRVWVAQLAAAIVARVEAIQKQRLRDTKTLGNA